MRKIAAIALIIAILTLSGTAAAYAYSTSVTNGFGMHADSYPVDILDGDGNPATSITIAAPTYDSSGNLTSASVQNVTGYKLYLPWDSTAQVRAWLFMDPGAWIYLEDAYLTIGGNDRHFDDENGGVAGNATSAFALAGSETAYAFTLVLVYKDTVDYLEDDDGNSILDAGLQLSFAASHNGDPVAPS